MHPWPRADGGDLTMRAAADVTVHDVAAARSPPRGRRALPGIRSRVRAGTAGP